jgi:hypothetical protein
MNPAASRTKPSADPNLPRFADRPAPIIHGAIDALSTLHKPFGLMHQVIEQAERNNVPVVRWNLIDVLERCPAERDCATCPLHEECGGIAKNRAGGFVGIDDAIRMKQRVSLDTWSNEMLCQRPRMQNAVYPSFDPAIHVREEVTIDSGCISLAVDFGFGAPFVCLWVRSDGAVTHVLDEHVQAESTIDEHMLEIRKRPWPTPTHIDCDPAGSARNDQTGMSNVQKLRRSGFVVRYRTSRVEEGVEAVRAALRPAAGEPTLFVHPRCKHLIRSLTCLTLARLRSGATPAQDGIHDHAADALRYHFVNRVKQAVSKRTY